MLRANTSLVSTELGKVSWFWLSPGVVQIAFKLEIEFLSLFFSPFHSMYLFLVGIDLTFIESHGKFCESSTVLESSSKLD